MKRPIAALLLAVFLFNIILPLNLFAADGVPIEEAYITINSAVDGASVILDGQDTGFVTPLPGRITAKPGYFKIRIQKAGYTTWRKDFLLTPGENIVLDAVMVPIDVSEKQIAAYNDAVNKPFYKKWWFWTIVAVAAGAAAAGGGGGGGGGGNAGTVTATW